MIPSDAKAHVKLDSLILSIKHRGWKVSLGAKQLIKTNKNTNKKLLFVTLNFLWFFFL